MNLFRIRGIRLSLHFTFFLWIGLLAAWTWVDEGWVDALWVTAAFLLFFGCVVLHELGHSFTAMHYGIAVRRILLMPIGGMAEMDDIPRQPWREVLITLAGPAVNFVLAGLLWLVVPDWAARLDGAPNLRWLAALMLAWNLRMGIFNLLPAFPMDGGRLLRAALSKRLPYLQATRWAATVGKVICTACIVTLATLAFRRATFLGDEPWLPAGIMIALFAFIFTVGEIEYRVLQRREVEAAHWKDVWSRPQFSSPPPPLPEPPLLPR